MRHIRNLVYLVVGLLLGAVFTFAHAETIAATVSGSLWYSSGYTTPIAWADAQIRACQGWATNNSYIYVGPVPTTEPASGTTASAPCYYKMSAGGNTYTYSGNNATLLRSGANYTCPTGQNWTLSGSNCTRPDCVAPATRQADGTCGSACLAKKGQYSSGYVSTPVNAPAPTGSVCLGGCEANRVLSLGDEMLLGKGLDWWPIGQTFTGNSCSGSDTGTGLDNSPTAPPQPQKKPPCADGEGVMTSSSGKVSCVPPGNPDASTPNRKKEAKKETYPDGSTKTTTTDTTVDPNTGAKDTTVTTTTTAATGGGAGQAGAVGTSTANTGTSSGGTNGTGNGKGKADADGNCDGNDCGGGHPFPAVSGLWEKKYPDGLSKVVSDRIAEMKTSGVGSLVGKLVPNNLPSGGTCPHYTFNMSIGPHMSYGGGVLNMPCGVWDFVRIVMLVSAALLARRLVFGG